MQDTGRGRGGRGTPGRGGRFGSFSGAPPPPPPSGGRGSKPGLGYASPGGRFGRGAGGSSPYSGGRGRGRGGYSPSPQPQQQPDRRQPPFHRSPSSSSGAAPAGGSSRAHAGGGAASGSPAARQGPAAFVQGGGGAGGGKLFGRGPEAVAFDRDKEPGLWKVSWGCSGEAGERQGRGDLRLRHVCHTIRPPALPPRTQPCSSRITAPASSLLACFTSLNATFLQHCPHLSPPPPAQTKPTPICLAICRWARLPASASPQPG